MVQAGSLVGLHHKPTTRQHGVLRGEMKPSSRQLILEFGDSHDIQIRVCQCILKCPIQACRRYGIVCRCKMVHDDQTSTLIQACSQLVTQCFTVNTDVALQDHVVSAWQFITDKIGGIIGKPICH